MQKLLYVHRHVFALIWTHNTTYVPSWIILFSCILPFGMRPHSFFFLPLPPENKLPLSFLVQNRNITGLFACPPPQTHVHTKDTHADTHWCAFPVDMDVFCLPVSHKGGKKDWRRKWKKECWRKRREGSVRRTYLHWWMKWTHVVFCVAICLRDSNHCQKRDRQRILPLSGSGLAEWQENEYIFKLSYI